MQFLNTINEDSIKRFGALYNWSVIKSGSIAPAGWHVPTDSEWTILEKYLVSHGYSWDGKSDSTDKVAKSLAAIFNAWYV